MKNCRKCNKEFEPLKGLKSYCSLSCRNSRVRDEETKLKISRGVLKSMIPTRHAKFGEQNSNWKGGIVDTICTCKVCNKEFVAKSNRKRKTCSKICQTYASTNRQYRNGSRKTYYYKGIVLESSWELRIAKLLDDKDIRWLRPAPINWTDSANNNRLYYPDFYLIDYNIYLDPKNPHCMNLDKEKMQIVKNIINIVYGDIRVVEDYVKTLSTVVNNK